MSLPERQAQQLKRRLLDAKGRLSVGGNNQEVGPEGPVVKDSWVTSQRSVNAFREYCLSRKWVFTETPEQTDFGKDGYLDFSKDGRLTGQCIAVQVKGGSSFRRGDSYVITADERRRVLWMDSSVPVFGIVWDPDSGELYWIDLTTELRRNGLETELRIGPEQRLEDQGGDSFLEGMWRSTAGPAIAASLGSDDPEVQDAAVFDIWGLGRSDARYFTLLRRVMFGLTPEVLDRAIYVLNQCSLNPDNFLDPRWISMKGREETRRHFLWEVDEAVALLDRAQDEDAFERGTFSSCIYWLLVGPDPKGEHFVNLVEAATFRAVQNGRDRAAKWGLVLRVYWAGKDGPKIFERLVNQAPDLRRHDVVREVASNLREFGYLSIG